MGVWSWAIRGLIVLGIIIAATMLLSPPKASAQTFQANLPTTCVQLSAFNNDITLGKVKVVDEFKSQNETHTLYMLSAEDSHGREPVVSFWAKVDGPLGPMMCVLWGSFEPPLPNT